MAKASPIISSFNSGELSPLMAGQVGNKFYPAGCKKLLNFIPAVQGPARRRPGTKFVEEVKNSANRTWLKRFVFNQDTSYVLEFGNLYIRFYTDGAQILSGGSPYEKTTPYTTADLTNDDGTFALKFYQSNDVLYIVHPDHAPRKLTRTGAATFSIATMDLDQGPFKDIDPDETISIYASAISGTGITLTASSSVFTSDHVGDYLFLEQSDNLTIKPWTTGKTYSLNQIVRSDGKNYKCLTGGTNTGTEKPVHTKGTRDDGKVDWEYMDSGFGWVKITAVASGTSATADVVQQLPDGCVGSSNDTTRWAFNLFSVTEGWPDNITSFRERLVLSRGLKLAFSIVGNFEDFSKYDENGLVVADMAIQIDITSDESNGVEWMAGMASALIIGTSGDEFAIREITTTQPFGPGNVKADRQSKHGSKSVAPAIVGEGIVFVQAHGRKMRDMLLAESVDVRWASADTTILAEHITKSGLVQITYQQEPDQVVWCVRGDGLLAGFTINREQEVRGWHLHQLGGYSDAAKSIPAVVECVETIPSGEIDELWMIVKRYIDGAEVRYIERMQPFYVNGDDIEDAFYVDCGLSLDQSVNATLTPGTGADVEGTEDVIFTAGSAVFSAGDVGKHIYFRYEYYDQYFQKQYDRAIALITAYTDTTHVKGTIWRAWPDLSAISANAWRKTATSISGLGHLEGETVAICGDAAVYSNETVSSGALTVDYPVSKAHIGLAYKSVLTTMPIEFGAADGTAQGKTKRIPRASLRFLDTIGADYGNTESDTLDSLLVRDASDLMDIGPSPFTGDVKVAWPSGYVQDATITVVQENPLPCTVVAVMPQLSVQDSA